MTLKFCDWSSLKSGEEMGLTSDLPHYKINVIRKARQCQTMTLTNLPTDIQPPILVAVHLAGEQTGKTITVLYKVIF